MSTIISCAVIVTAWLWVCRRVRRHEADCQMQTAPEGRYADIQDAIRRSQIG